MSVKRRLHPVSAGLISISLAATLWVSPAEAQVGVPAQADPGVVIPSPAEQQFEQKRQRQEKYLPPKEQVEDQEFSIEKSPRQDMPGNQKFTVSAIKVEGNTIFTAEQLDFITSGYENRQISLSDLSDMAEAIANYYREAGYLTTQAFIPPQEIEEGGVLTVKVVEGKVGEFCVQGNKFYRTSTIAKNFRSRPGEPLNVGQLEEDLRRVNRLYDYRVRANLTPGDETGETNIRIDTKEAQPWQIAPTFDNQGRPFIGYYRAGAEVYNNSVLGYGDRFYTRYFGAEGTQSVLSSYFVPVNKHGDELGVNFGYTHVDVDLDVANQPDIDGSAHDFGLMYVHPFDRDRVWVGDVGFSYRRIENLVNDVRVFNGLDEIRTVHAALNYDKFDKWGRTFVRTQASLGIDAFGGNWPFFKVENFATRLITLPWDNLLILRSYSQFSPNDLPTAEAYQLGGAYSVRGYTEGLFIGDRGFNFSIEDRFPIPFLGMISPWLDDRLQGAVFFDIGQTWLDRDNVRFIPGFSNKSENTLLMGTGFGLRARLSQYLMGFLDVGFGLVDRGDIEPDGQPTARIHFGIRSELLPKNYIARTDRTQCVNPSDMACRHDKDKPPSPTPPGTGTNIVTP